MTAKEEAHGPASPSDRSRTPLSPVTNFRQSPAHLGQGQGSFMNSSPRTSIRLGDLRQAHPPDGSGGDCGAPDSDLYMFDPELGAFQLSPLAEPYQRMASTLAYGSPDQTHTAASPFAQYQLSDMTDLRESYCGSEASFTTVQRHAAAIVQALQPEEPASPEVESREHSREEASLPSSPDAIASQEKILLAARLQEDTDAADTRDLLQSTTFPEGNGKGCVPIPICTIESHRDLLKRAEAAKQRCQTLEAELLLEKEHAEQHADALQEVVQRAQAAEDRADEMAMELAAASDNSERFLLENAALQDRVATLEKNLQDTRGDQGRSAQSAWQDPQPGTTDNVQQSPALTPAAGVGAAEVRGADTETGRKRARHSRSGGVVPRTLGFEDADSCAAGQAMLPPADLPSVPGLDNDATAEGAHGKPLGLTEVKTTGNEGERKAASSASSESEEESASGGGAAAAAAKALARVMRLHSEQAQLQRAIQAMTSERVALMVRHEAVLGRLEEALQENSSLQALLLEQANQVGALGAAQEAISHQVEAQKQLQSLQEHGLQSQVLQLQQQVEGSEEAAAKWAETHDALQVMHGKLQHERELVIALQNEKTALQDRLEAAQQTPPRVREAEARLRSERARIEALLAENAALSMRAQQLQEAAALQDSPLPLTAECGQQMREQAFLEGHWQGDEVEPRDQLYMISMALQHEQQRGSHLKAQLEAVSEQLLEAQQALLDEQLRADHLAGQRDSLGRTLQQAQKALHDSERERGRPWSADDARQADVHRWAAGRQARALPVDPAAAASTEATPEKAGRPKQPVGQGSPGSQQKLSPGRERMARELGQARQWLVEAVDHRNALQQQQQELQGQVSALQEALQRAGGAAQAIPEAPAATPAQGGRISDSALASLVESTPSDLGDWHTQLQRTGPQELSFASPSSRGDSALTQRPSVAGRCQPRPAVTPLSAHISALHHRLNTPLSAAACARLDLGSILGSGSGSASSLSRGWTPSAWDSAALQQTAAANGRDQGSASGSSGPGLTPAADALNPLFDEAPTSSKSAAEKTAKAGTTRFAAASERQEEVANMQETINQQSAAADQCRLAQAELEAQLRDALRKISALTVALEVATAEAQAARNLAAAAGEDAVAAKLVSEELSLQLENAHEQLSLAQQEARRLMDAQVSALAPCTGPAEDTSATDALMARVRAQNMALRATLDSLAMARSELAASQADTRQLSRIIEALHANHLRRSLAPPQPSPARSAPRPPQAAPGAGSAMHCGSSGGRNWPQSAGSPLGATASQGGGASLQFQEGEVWDQLALKSSRLEALEAELEVARSQNAEWHRLMALYDRERAAAADQRRQIQELEQQVEASRSELPTPQEQEAASDAAEEGQERQEHLMTELAQAQSELAALSQDLQAARLDAQTSQRETQRACSALVDDEAAKAEIERYTRDLQAACHDREEELARMKGQLAAEQAEKDNLGVALGDLQAESERLRAEVADQAAELAKLQLERCSLQDSLNTAAAKLAAVPALQQQLAVARGELQGLERALHEQGGTEAALKEQVATLSRRLDGSQKEAEAAETAAAGLKTELAHASERAAGLQGLFDAAHETAEGRTAAQLHVAAMEGQLADSHAEAHAEQTALDAVREELARSHEHAASLQALLDAAHETSEECAALKEQVSKLGGQLAGSQAEADAAHKSSAELRIQLAQSQEHTASLQALLDAAHGCAEECAALKEQVAALEEQLTARQAQADAACEASEALEIELAQSREQAASLQDLLDAAHGTSEECAALKEQVGWLEGQLAARQAQADAACEALEALEIELAESCEQAEKQSQECAVLREQISNLVGNLAARRAEVDAARQASAALDAELAQSHEQAANLQKLLDAAERRAEEHAALRVQQISALQGQLVASQAQVNAACKASGAVENELEQSREHAASLQKLLDAAHEASKEVAALRQQIGTLSGQLSASRAKAAAAQSASATQQRELSQSQDRAASLQKLLDAAHEAAAQQDTLTQQLAAVTNQLDTSKADAEAARTLAESLEEQLAQSREHSASVQKLLDAADEVAAQQEALNQQIAAVTGQLESSKAETEAARAGADSREMLLESRTHSASLQRLVDAAHEAAGQRDTLTQQLAAVTSQLGADMAEAQAARSAVTSLEEQLAQSREHSVSLQKLLDPAHEAAGLRDTLTQQLAALTSQLAASMVEAQAARSAVTSLEEQLAQSREHSVSLQKLLDAAHDTAEISAAEAASLHGSSAEPLELAKRLCSAQQSLAASQEEVRALQQAAAGAAQVTATLESDISRLQEENLGLCEEISQWQERAAGLVGAVAALESEIRELRAAAEVAADAAERAQRSTVDARAAEAAEQSRALEAATAMAAGGARRIAELEAEQTALRSEAASASAAAAEAEDKVQTLILTLMEAHKEMSAERASAQQERAQFLAKHDQSLSQLAVECEAARSEAAESASKVNQLQEQLGEVREQLRKATVEKQRHQQRAALLNESVQELQDELFQVKASVEAMSQDLQEKHAALRAEADGLRQLATDRGAAIKVLERAAEVQEARLRAEARGHAQAAAALRDEVSATNARADGLQKLFDFAQAEIAGNASTLSADQAREAWEKLRAAELQHWAELLQAEQQVTSLLRQRITALEADTAEQRKQLSRAQSDSAAADRRAADLAEQCSLAEARSTKMQLRIEELSGQLSGMRAENEKITAQRRAQEKKSAEVKHMVASILEDAADLESRARRADVARQAAVEQLARVRSAAASMCEEAADAAAALEAAAAERQAAEAESEQLAQHVSAQQAELQSLRAKSALLQSALSAEKSRAEAATASVQAALQAALLDLDNSRTLLEDTQARLAGAEEDLETSEQIRGLERKRADEAQEELEAVREALQAAELNTHSLRRQLHEAQARARAGEENHAEALASAEKHKVWAEALAAKLRSAGTDLAALEAERIAALWKADAPLKALQHRPEQLQRRAEAAEKQASMAAAEADERLAQVKAQVAEQDGELQRIGRENAVEREALRREVQSIRDALQRAQAQQEHAQAASSASQAEAGSLRMQLAGAQALCQQLEQDVADAQNGEQAAAAALQDARQELAATQRRAATLGLRLGDSRARLQRLQAAQAAAAWQLPEASSTSPDAAADISSNAEEQKSATSVPEGEEMVQELQRQLEDAQAALSAQAEAAAQEQARRRDAEEQCAAAHAEARQLWQELQDLQGRLREAEAAAVSASAEATELQGALAAAQEAKAAAQATAEEAAAVSDALSHRASEAQGEMSRAQALAKKALAECAASKATHAGELTALRQQCASLDAAAADLEEQLRQERHSRATEVAAAHNAQIKLAEACATSGASGECSAQQYGAEQEAEIQSLEAMCRELSSELAAKEGRVQELLTSVASLQEENARLWDEAQQGLSLADNMAEMHQRFQEELDNVARLKEMNQENACLRQENTSLRAALAHATPHALSGHPPDAADADGLGSLPRNLGSAFTLAAQQSDSSAPSSPTGTVGDAASTRQEPGSCPGAASGSEVSSGAASPARPSAEAASSGVGPLFLAFDSSPSPDRTAPGLHSKPGTSQGRAIRYWQTAAASGDGEEAAQQLTPVFVQPTPQAIPAWREESIRQGASVENTPRSAAEHAHHLVAQLSAQVAAVRTSAERQPPAVSIQTPPPSRLRHSSGASITLPEAQEGTSEIGTAGQPGADQQCTPSGGNAAGDGDGGLVRRLRAQLGRLSGNRGGCPPGTPMSLAADRRVAFLRAIDRLEAIQAENSRLWAALESQSTAQASKAGASGSAAGVCEQYAAMCQRMEAILRERADVAARLSAAQVMMQQLQGAVETLGQENGRLAAQVAQLQHSAAGTEQAHSNAAAAEAQDLRAEVQRLKLERKLTKAVAKVAVAIVSDMCSGGADAVNVALRLGELMRAHQELLNRMGIAPMWATLLALAHNPPKPAGQVSAELAASEAQAATLQEQLQKQAQRASRYKERARQLEDVVIRLRQQTRDSEDGCATAAAAHDDALLSAAREVAGVGRALCEALPQLCTEEATPPDANCSTCIDCHALLHLQVDRLKCLVHRVTLQQLLGQDYAQPPQPPSGHLHALLEQPPDRGISAESVADRILEWAADRRPQKPAALPQPPAPPSPLADHDLPRSSPCLNADGPRFAATLAEVGSGQEDESGTQSEAYGRRAGARGRGRGTWRDGDDSGAASVSNSDRAEASSSFGSPAKDTSADSSQRRAVEADQEAEEAFVAHGDEGQALPEAGSAAGQARAADVGHLTPTAMHAGARVAEARAKAAKLGAQLDRVLAVRAGGPLG